MKTVMMISMLALSMAASAKGWPVDTLNQASVDNPFLQRLTPTLTTDYVQVGKINQHWFFGIQGGVSAFIGKPLGCGDFFDRTVPSFNAYLGKWFTPNVGARVSFQGLKYKNCDLEKMSYQLAHADLMYNIANLFRSPSESMPKWDFAPHIGVGLAHGSNMISPDGRKLRNLQFALTYGIFSRYHVSQRIFLSGELGGFSTFREFDGNGDRGKLGDNMLSLSLGIGVNL